ncbi:hypothetical protein GF406_02415 [candidate division KSB1 bacterium]|nr:hypothetical protein [candidate division KSB1 bacterium]
MLMQKLPKTRGFDYKCQFYNPDVESEDEGRIKFRRIRKSPPAEKGSVLRLLALFFVALLFFLYLYKAGTPTLGKDGNQIQVKDVIVVE